MEAELLQKRVDNAKAEVAKATKRVEKWAKTLNATQLAICENTKTWQETHTWNKDYGYELADRMMEYRHAVITLAEAKTLLAKYENLMAIKTAKANDVKIAILVAFLASWRAKARAWYIDRCEDYINTATLMRANINAVDYYTQRAEYDRLWNVLNHYTRNADTFVKVIADYHTQIIDTAKLDKELDEEVERKYYNLVERISEKAGHIEDVRGLYIASNCEINGVVVGDKAKAKVETITAGGWNIQCEHYRVLVNVIK